MSQAKKLLLGFCLLALNLFIIASQQPISAQTPLSPDDGLSLGLGLGLARSSEAPAVEVQQTPAIQRILVDNYEGEFASTEHLLGAISSLLESFAKGESLAEADLLQGQAINRWLAASGGSALGRQNSLLAKQVQELDFVFASFRPQVWQLIRRVITERPPQANSLQDLAFRCEHRAQEIQLLNELASKSSIYRILLDVFNTELYTHCLRRKLATLRLNKVEPPSEVRQMVDVYLGLPLEVVRTGGANFRIIGDAARAKMIDKMYADYGQNFNLQTALGRYGPLEQATELLLTSDMSFGRVDPSHARAMVADFREQCVRYTGELVQQWAQFDQIAAALSSETNNLADFNNRLKFALPHLIYASVCNQLSATIA